MTTTIVERKAERRNPFLTGVLGPQRTILAQEVGLVSGSIPSQIFGLYVRNGANPVGDPRTGKHHWFEGDGMLHGVWLSPETSAQDKAFYGNRYVETNSYKINAKEVARTGKKFFNSIFMDLRGPWRLLNFLISTTLSRLVSKIPFIPLFVHNLFRTRWVAKDNNNTSVLHHHGRLFALVESGLPREVSARDLATLGEATFGNKLTHPFTAHPKVCSSTGECVFFGYNVDGPFCALSSISKDGVKAPSVEVPIPSPVMMHDFGITQNYALFLDLPLAFAPDAVIQGKGIFSWKDNHASRIGVVERKAIHDRSIRSPDCPKKFDDHDVKKGLRKVPVQWFSLENPCFIFHVAASYEEYRLNSATGARDCWVVLFAVAHPAGFDLDVLGGFDTRKHQHDAPLMGIMTRYECNLTTGELRETTVSPKISCEFPVIHEKHVGLPVKYCYVSANLEGDCVLDMKNPIRLEQIVKYNLTTMQIVGSYAFPKGSFIGEFSFVPSDAPNSAEDDGFLVGYLTEQVITEDEESLVRCLRSFLCIFNAQSMSLVAKIALPQAVPLGFHGTFVPNIRRCS